MQSLPRYTLLVRLTVNQRPDISVFHTDMIYLPSQDMADKDLYIQYRGGRGEENGERERGGEWREGEGRRMERGREGTRRTKELRKIVLHSNLVRYLKMNAACETN